MKRYLAIFSVLHLYGVARKLGITKRVVNEKSLRSPDPKGLSFVIQSLNKLSRRNLIKLFWTVKNNTALEYKLKEICDKICILTKMKFISKQNKYYKIGNRDNRLSLPINLTCMQIEDVNLPKILNQREVTGPS